MSAELKPGVLLRGKWRLDKFLGRGGMSSVYAATHRNGMRSAIKVLHRELTTNAVVKRRFLREGYVANKVEHPGAVKVLDDDQSDDGLVFLVMELLEGITLKQKWIAAKRRLDVMVATDVIEQVLDVLESAHKRGIVHRDLKPDNIFIVTDGSVKVLDFGIARLLEATLPNSADTTSSAAMMGTPAFMPPEQALAHWNKVDGRSDLYALAATAFTVLTGRLVHTGSTIPELLIASATRQAESIRAVMPELDEGIAAVIDRGLRFDIAERWPDARSMRLGLVDARAKAAGGKSRVVLANGDEPTFVEPPRSTRTGIELYAPLDEDERLGEDGAPQSEPGDADAETMAYVPASADKQPPSMGNTPVRLQEAMRPDDVVRLVEVHTEGETTSRKRSRLGWVVAGASAVGVVAIVLWVGAGSRADPGGPSSASTATSARSAPAPEETSAAATETVEVAPASATVETSAPSPEKSAPRTSQPVKRPPRCVEFSEFDGRCVQYR